MTPNVVVLAVSAAWEAEQIYRDVLRKLHDANPRATIRTTSRSQGATREARDFAETLGLSIEEWPLQSWPKYAAEIRNQGMLDGYIREPHNPLIVIEKRPRADLLMAFHSNTSDNVQELIKRRIHGGDPLVVYREIKIKNKRTKEVRYEGIERAENDKKKRNRFGEWRKIQDA